MDLATRKMVYYGLLGLLVAGSTIAVFQVPPQVFHTTILPKDGTLSMYLANIQPDISGNPMITSNPLQSLASHVSGKPSTTLLSLNVTIDSVTIHETGDSKDNGTVVSNTKFTFNVLGSKLISKVEVPAENVTMVELHVASATASVQGLGLETVKVPGDVLKIHVNPEIHIKAQMSSSILISGTAHIVFQGNNSIILTPVLHAEETTGPQ